MQRFIKYFFPLFHPSQVWHWIDKSKDKCITKLKPQNAVKLACIFDLVNQQTFFTIIQHYEYNDNMNFHTCESQFPFQNCFPRQPQSASLGNSIYYLYSTRLFSNHYYHSTTSNFYLHFRFINCPRATCPTGQTYSN